MSDQIPTTTEDAPWPPAFVERVRHIAALHEGMSMQPDILRSVIAGIRAAIRESQCTGELGEWVQLAGGGVSETHGVPDGVWALIVVDGIDRPSMTITIDGRAPVGTGARRLQDLRSAKNHGQ